MKTNIYGDDIFNWSNVELKKKHTKEVIVIIHKKDIQGMSQITIYT